MALPGSPKKDSAAAGFGGKAVVSALVGEARASAAGVRGLLVAWETSVTTGGVGTAADDDEGDCADAASVASATGAATAGAGKGLGGGEAGAVAAMLAVETGVSVGEAVASTLIGVAGAAAPGRNLGGCG